MTQALSVEAQDTLMVALPVVAAEVEAGVAAGPISGGRSIASTCASFASIQTVSFVTWIIRLNPA